MGSLASVHCTAPTPSTWHSSIVCNNTQAIRAPVQRSWLAPDHIPSSLFLSQQPLWPPLCRHGTALCSYERESAPSCRYGKGAMLSYQTSCRHQMTFEGSPSHRIFSVMNCAAVPTYGLPLWLARPAIAKMATLGFGSMLLTTPS